MSTTQADFVPHPIGQRREQTKRPNTTPQCRSDNCFHFRCPSLLPVHARSRFTTGSCQYAAMLLLPPRIHGTEHVVSANCLSPTTALCGFEGGTTYNSDYAKKHAMLQPQRAGRKQVQTSPPPADLSTCPRTSLTISCTQPRIKLGNPLSSACLPPLF